MRSAVVAICVMLAPSSLFAGQNVWTNSGPAVGTVWDITIHPTVPTTLFAGTEGGLYKSLDSGASWNVVSSAPAGTNVNAVKFAPSNSAVVYLGTSSTPTFWKSSDGGATWTSSNGIGQRVTALAIDPTNASVVYAGCGDGVCRTTDGGTSWSRTVLAGGVSVYGLAVDPRVPAVVYASAVGGSDGVYRTTDGGVTWSAVNSGLTACNGFLAYDVAIDGSTSPSTVYVASACSGIARSTDGMSWTQIHSNLDGEGSFSAAYSISISSASPSTLYAGGENGVYRSTNGGSSWTTLSTPADTGSFFSEIETDPTNASNLYAASNTDLLRSSSGGSSWTQVTTLPAFFIESIALHPGSGNLFAGGYEFLFRSTDNGTSWSRIGRYPKFKVSDIKIKGDVIYAWMQPLGCLSFHPTGLSALVKSTDAGATWSVVFQSQATSARKIAIDPQNSNTVYLTTKLAIGKSTNGGTSFSTITGTAKTSDDAPIMVHATNSSILFYGGKDGVYKSTDGGSTWTLKNSGVEMYAVYPIMALGADPANPDHIFAGSLVALYESQDAGETWIPRFPLDIESGPYNDLSPTSIVVDPSSASKIQVSTRTYGVVKTTDAGASWSLFNSGLIDPRVSRLIAGTGGRFHAATMGSGVFNLDTVATAPQAPVLVATANGTASVNVSWTNVGATSYSLERSDDNVSFFSIASGPGLTFVDPDVVGGRCYFYRVAGDGGALSNTDFATTVAFTDDPIVPGVTVVKADHVSEIHAAIDIVRAALALRPAGWRFQDGVLAGEFIQAIHVSELRSWMSNTLTAFGRSITYTDSMTAGQTIRAVHLQELRNALK